MHYRGVQLLHFHIKVNKTHRLKALFHRRATHLEQQRAQQVVEIRFHASTTQHTKEQDKAARPSPLNFEGHFS